MKKALIFALTTAALTLGSFGDGLWFKEVSNRYDYTKYATWLMTQLKINFGVWPVAPGHSAGCVFTDDGWNSVNWQNAQWEYNAQGAYGTWDEHWTVYITAAGENGQYMGQDLVPFNIEFALYLVDQYGNWYWDNNGGLNYSYFID